MFGSKLSRFTLAVAATFAAGVIALPALADARSVYRSGSPGQAYADHAIGTASNDGTHPIMRLGEVNAYRSSAYASTQLIEAKYRLWYFSGSQNRWVHVNTHTQSRSVAPGYRARMFSNRAYLFEFDESALYTPSTWSIDVVITYRTRYGAWLGTIRGDFDSAAATDYVCASTTYVKCWLDPDVNGQGAGMLFGYGGLG